MAVYTKVSDQEIRAFLTGYDIGDLITATGIAEGVENSNYLLRTQQGRFILTLYEQRVKTRDLPFFLSLMRHLVAAGFPAPLPLQKRDGHTVSQLCGRPAALISFLPGGAPRRITPARCAALGEAMARMHLATADFQGQRHNDYALDRWRQLADICRPHAGKVHPNLARIIDSELMALNDLWPGDLPGGIIHGDLFPDNVFFHQGRFCGIIDYYFACRDFLAYDIAICLNAWCFSPDGRTFHTQRAAALITAYTRVRPLTMPEITALPVLARGAALRFLLTRLHDWFAQPDTALVKPKDPRQYIPRLYKHQAATGPAAYGITQGGS